MSACGLSLLFNKGPLEPNEQPDMIQATDVTIKMFVLLFIGLDDRVDGVYP